jgi:hypothetical protein
MENAKLAWLAGIWDGEGSITIFSHIEKDGCRKLCPTINVTNTDIAMIAEIIKILDGYGIIFSLNKVKTKKEHSDCYHLITRNMTKIKKTLELLLPYLVNKKPQAEILLRFVNSRLSKMLDGKKPWNWQYTEEEQTMEQQMRLLNGIIRKFPRD